MKLKIKYYLVNEYETLKEIENIKELNFIEQWNGERIILYKLKDKNYKTLEYERLIFKEKIDIEVKEDDK